jgi:hypothetical protein
MDISYPILFGGGTTNKAEATKKLPMLDRVISYPTMIILDKNNEVRKIHTGFSGPATSEYGQFQKEFREFIELLASE